MKLSASSMSRWRRRSRRWGPMRRPPARRDDPDLGARMPGFLAYVGYAVAILVPILLIQWVIFIA